MIPAFPYGTGLGIFCGGLMNFLKRLAVASILMATGCGGSGGGGVSDLVHTPSVVSSPVPAPVSVPSGLTVANYPKTLNCDQSKNGTSVAYYPGQTDYVGNTVPAGTAEVFQFTYDSSWCNRFSRH
jgi:hypothetical protein